MPPTATVPRSTSHSPESQHPLSDAAVRIVYQAVRTLVPEEGTIALSELTLVTCLDPGETGAAMNRLARRGPFDASRRAQAGEPTWQIRRTDR